MLESIEWQNVYDDNVPPDFMALYFENGLIMWNLDSRIHVSHSNKIPKCADDLNSIISNTILIDNNTEKKETYSKEKGFDCHLFKRVS
jgi:hypothetical protein